MTDAATAPKRKRATRTKGNNITPTKAPEGAVQGIQRYSDTDLTEFRELIQRKLEAAKKEAVYLQGLLKGTDDHAGDHEKKSLETNAQEKESINAMYSRQVVFIDKLTQALVRIENGTYGICTKTGKLIDKGRLRAVPHTTQSIEAKMGCA